MDSLNHQITKSPNHQTKIRTTIAKLTKSQGKFQKGKNQIFLLTHPIHQVIAGDDEDNVVDYIHRVLYPKILLNIFRISYFQPPRVPPIYIKNIKNFSALNNTPLQLTGSNGISGKPSLSFPIIRPRRRSNYNAIHFRSRLDVYKRQILY
ncbi:unnamed protein product [Macrosiphum euphorbiae]|uniref:Uncharacterized protein n=1 Tax=Macrosiphum euphorbiae TaxID=13131 RepID=A0AAV0W2Y6_9HEMI|nr:unnamed protein product [Macrosiphum euphorbiae]